jgi:DNA-binding NarL/FixJ family response regulator
VAFDGFHRLGAAPWASRAQVELRATGAASKRGPDSFDRDELTAHELQVAIIVAEGATNKEAAAALFLSPKTIEFHLAQIYRKLGIRRRAELATFAAKHGWLPDRGPAPAASIGPRR